MQHVESPRMDDAGLEPVLAARAVAPRVTLADLDAAIVAEQYLQPEGTTLTICVLTLRNGFNVTGESAAASPENFDADIGRRLARTKARDAMWPLLGYALKQDLWRASLPQMTEALPPGHYRKKPVVIQAAQWFKNGDHPEDYAKPREGLEGGVLRTWTGEEARALGWEGAVVRYYRRPDDDGERACEHCGQRMHVHGWIDTKEGGHIVCPGDWIITGVKGERYPCKPDIFAATYEVPA